jgi:hypothetical protein
MGRPRLAVAVAWLLALGPGPAPPEAAGEATAPRRYSGRVERVELTEGLLVVESLGWRGRPELHAVQVTPETPIVSAGRLPAHEMRGLSTYSEIPVELVDVLAGDFVVVETTGPGPRELALRVTVVERQPSRKPPPVR